MCLRTVEVWAIDIHDPRNIPAILKYLELLVVFVTHASRKHPPMESLKHVKRMRPKEGEQHPLCYHSANALKAA